MTFSIVKFSNLIVDLTLFGSITVFSLTELLYLLFFQKNGCYAFEKQNTN